MQFKAIVLGLLLATSTTAAFAAENLKTLDFDTLHQHAVQGEPDYARELANRFEEGLNGLDKNKEEALRFYTIAATSGEPADLRKMGHIYNLGELTKRDHAKAIKWYSKAAEKGDARAAYLAGTLYIHGENIPHDQAKGIEFLTRASQLGMSEAALLLGAMYENGDGAPVDMKKAIAFYERAAELKEYKAYSYLGYIYDKGENGIPADPVKAKKWYKAGAELGDPSSEFFYAVKIFNDAPEEAMKYLRHAAYQGDSSAQYNLALVYKDGYANKPADIVRAIAWIKIASANKHPHAPALYEELKKGAKQADLDAADEMIKTIKQSF